MTAQEIKLMLWDFLIRLRFNESQEAPGFAGFEFSGRSYHKFHE